MSKFLFTIMATLALLFSGSGVAGAVSAAPTAQQCAEAKQSADNLKALSAKYPTNKGLELLAANAAAQYEKYC